jgi:hypothetical protein
MTKKKVLFVCGSMNQTTQMHKISEEMTDFECYFTPFYAQGHPVIEFVSSLGLLDFSILGGQAKKKTLSYLKENNLKIDEEGQENKYDLVYLCADLLLPKNLNGNKIILVQEGMTDPENFAYHLVTKLHLPRWLASTSTFGLSNSFDLFCVASEGYKEHFISKGVDGSKIRITGIPNFDNSDSFLKNDFPYKNYVLVATSDMRETYKFENRKKFIQKAVKIANGRQIIFKLHPNEKAERAINEIEKFAPGSLVFHHESIDSMIANCDVLITRYSSVVYIGLALGKDVYSDFDVNKLKMMIPIQNGGTSSKIISDLGRELLDNALPHVYSIEKNLESKFGLVQKFRLKRRLAKIKN